MRDPETSELGYVYAYLWLTDPPANPGLADYVTWDGPGGLPCDPTTENPGCGWLKSLDSGSISSLPRFNSFFKGNWTNTAVCIRQGVDPGTCTPMDSSLNLLDISRWRTTGPVENSNQWDRVSCRAFLGVKDGPVRVIRRIQGAMSGKYTTKTELFYGSWMEQTVNLRVHPIDSIHFSSDHRVVDWQNPPGESPANFFVQTHSQNHNKASADLIDGSSPANMDSPQYTDWVQIDTSKGTAIYYQDTPRGFKNTDRDLVYEDSLEANPGLQAGQFGEVGVLVTPIPPAQDLPDYEDRPSSCTEYDPEAADLNFGRVIRTYIPLQTDTQSPGGEYLSEEGEAYGGYRENPLIAAIEPSVYTQPLPPVDPICTPVLSGTAGSGGFSTTLNVDTTACGNGYAGTLLYRGIVPGVYHVLADLGKDSSTTDMDLSEDTTFRYVVRAYDRDGNLGPQSSELALLVNDTVPPPTPINLTVTPGSEILVVNWDAINHRDLLGVYVEIATSSGGTFVRRNPNTPVPSGNASFALMNLLPQTTYFIKLKAVDHAGNESIYSLEATGTTLP